MKQEACVFVAYWKKKWQAPQENETLDNLSSTKTPEKRTGALNERHSVYRKKDWCSAWTEQGKKTELRVGEGKRNSMESRNFWKKVVNCYMGRSHHPHPPTLQCLVGSYYSFWSFWAQKKVADQYCTRVKSDQWLNISVRIYVTEHAWSGRKQGETITEQTPAMKTDNLPNIRWWCEEFRSNKEEKTYNILRQLKSCFPSNYSWSNMPLNRSTI